MSASIPRGASRLSGKHLNLIFRSSRCSRPHQRPHFLQDANQVRTLFTKNSKLPKTKMSRLTRATASGVTSVLIGGALIYILYENNYLQPLPPTRTRSSLVAERRDWRVVQQEEREEAVENAKELSELPFDKSVPSAKEPVDNSAWGTFSSQIDAISSVAGTFTDINWTSISDSITDFILPEWARVIPGQISKLQRELAMAPGSLADDIWKEAHDPFLNPEINMSAKVRVSQDLCDEEKEFLRRRKKHTTIALAKYLGIPVEEVHPDDVPTIAMVGSGGGLRACVAGAGSLLAAQEAGLFDCATYTAGVSGSCWLQAIFHSSLSGQRLDRVVDHLKSRIGVHLAYPPAALNILNSAPTNKFLLKGVVEKLKGDPQGTFGLVDVYGLLLGARLLVPKGELAVNDEDLKISNQRNHVKDGQTPLPIYCSVRHEIPIIEESSDLEKATDSPSEATKEKAKQESWFQWVEFTPYEFFCEEFSAGIPTWAVGRKFNKGRDLPYDESGVRVPEYKLPLLLGIFGSAFCATLNLYYNEVRPMVKGLAIDSYMEGRKDDLSKVHPIEPAAIPNPFIGMEDTLPDTTPESIHKNEYIQLMDAGMSNNLPIYPLLRPGRNVDILIAFDASADVRQDNWLSVADGYARQRGIKGWPLGAGWPRVSASTEQTTAELDEAERASASEAESKIEDAKQRQEDRLEAVSRKGGRDPQSKGVAGEDPKGLGYCTVWVGTTEEREHTDQSTAPQSKAEAEDWQLMQPDAGIAVVYLPFLSNPKVEGINPMTSPYMSTWNFIYTPEDVDNVVRLAKANFEEGKERTRRTVRAVYERKKKIREERENRERHERWRKKVRLGVVGKKGEGDHFS